ncbi:MAG: T9SS type A sorting domain-containing protein [Bacteroidetes bacterium]|nr:T9SS type A sorting domain-containing protein [Bacteroidota bacterium]
MRNFKILYLVVVICCCLNYNLVTAQNIDYSGTNFIRGDTYALESSHFIICSNDPASIVFQDQYGTIITTYNKLNAGCDTVRIDSLILTDLNVGQFNWNDSDRVFILSSSKITLYEGWIFSNGLTYPTHNYFRLLPPPNMAGTANINLAYTKQFYFPLSNTNYIENGNDLLLIGIQDTSHIKIYPNWPNPLLNGNNYYSFSLFSNGGIYEKYYNNNQIPVAPIFYPPCLIVQDTSIFKKGRFLTRTGMYAFGSATSNVPWGLSSGFRFYPLAYEFLGKSYHTIPHLTRAGDSLLAIAFHDSTVISLNGVVSTINRGEVFRTLLDSPGVWQSNHPFSLVQISRHQQEDSVLYSSLFAYSVHPDSALITSTWYTTEIVPDSTPGEQSYLNLISPTNGVAYVKLDGVSLSSNFVPYASDTSWSYAQIPVTSVQHKLEADSGVLAYAYQYSLGCGIGFYVGGLEMKNTITSVASPIIKTDIIIYPNPAHQTLNIDLGDTPTNATLVTVKLFTVEGKSILTSTLKNKGVLSLDISNIANGIYFTEITIEGKRITKKFVKN